MGEGMTVNDGRRDNARPMEGFEGQFKEFVLGT